VNILRTKLKRQLPPKVWRVVVILVDAPDPGEDYLSEKDLKCDLLRDSYAGVFGRIESMDVAS
jgi:hypothetical protein